MATRTYSDITIKKLFSLSGNKCAFPECECNIVDLDGNFIGEIAHIEGLNEGSKRYNAMLANPNDFDNLMVMCPTHHTLIDKNEIIYTVSLLKQWKGEHENRVIENSTIYRPSAEIIQQVLNHYNTQNNDNRVINQNLGGGNMFVNEASVNSQIGTQINTTTTHINNYGGQNIDQNIIDDKIIAEIFNYIDENLSIYPFNSKKDYKKLQIKIPLNFPREERNRVENMIRNVTLRKNLVSDYLKKQTGLHNDKPALLAEKIQSNFCKLMGVNTNDIEIKDANIFDELAKICIPPSKQNDSEYLGNAKAIILNYFEICVIGKLTEEEVKQNLTLFE